MVILLRSLQEAKQYVLHRSTGESYGACRLAALHHDMQQRLFLDLNFGGKPEPVYELYAASTVVTAPDVFSMVCTDHDGALVTAWMFAL